MPTKTCHLSFSRKKNMLICLFTRTRLVGDHLDDSETITKKKWVKLTMSIHESLQNLGGTFIYYEHSSKSNLSRGAFF